MVDYDPHQWRRHLLDFHGTMLREIGPRLAAITAWSAIVLSIHHYGAPVGISSAAHGLVGVALGLLLVFRTNASYDRFWEGRKLWGGIVNESRNLGRQAIVLLEPNPTLRLELLRWTMLFPFAVMQKLRGGDLAQLIGGSALPAPELDAVCKAPHPALAVAVRMTVAVERARKLGLITDIQQGIVDQNVQQLVDYLGACERIHKTPLPFAYVVHLRRALLLYCVTLPFALVDAFGWVSVLGTAIITYVFFGIEEIGVEIEDPFGTDANDLPLERICDNIRKNVAGMAGLA